MRSTRLLGSIAGAACVVAVLLSAGAASASTLCTSAPETKGGNLVCKKGTQYTLVNAEGKSEGAITFAITKNPTETVECKASSFEDQLSQVGEKMIGLMKKGPVFETCTTTIKNCKVKSVAMGANVENEMAYVGTKAPEGEFVLREPPIGIEFVCSITFGCLYGSNFGELVSAPFYNSEQKAKFSTEIHRVGTFLACPETLTWTGTYSFFGLSGEVEGKMIGAEPIFVAKE